MARIYRVSGVQSSGSASALARALTALSSNLRVRVDPEQGIVDIRGAVSDFMVADIIKKSGCTYLGTEDYTEL